MSIKSNLIRTTAKVVCKREEVIANAPQRYQQEIFNKLMLNGKKTVFGKDHSFSKIKSIKDYQAAVPVRDYEGLRTYFDRAAHGEMNVLWPGKPKYLAKTSGTTSGTKYIPITQVSVSNHINSARNALFSYVYHVPETKIFDGKMLFLSGSPELEFTNGIATGRLSGIVNHEIPAWFKGAKLPDYKLNCIEPWELKVEKIIEDLLPRDLRAISGIPPWVQMLFEKLLEKTGKKNVLEVFPNLELYIHGGVNYQPYESRMNDLIGKKIALIETYPASEGFIAYQDNPFVDEMRLIIQSGIFYEFIPLSEVGSSKPSRLLLNEVELNTDYAIVLSSNAGLWSYLLGDLVKFTSLKPYKLKVSGRVSQYISAFGEHVIASEIEAAMAHAQKIHGFSITEFCVAPHVNPDDQALAYHEWFIEFEHLENEISKIEETLNDALCKRNSYYKDLIVGKILDRLKIRVVRKDGFKEYMMSINKYGEQFKVQRLSNDRKVAVEMKKKLL